LGARKCSLAYRIVSLHYNRKRTNIQ